MSKNTPASIPSYVAESAKRAEPIDTRTLLVRGTTIKVEDYASGYIGITNPAFAGEVAGVERFGYTNHAKGFFTALASVKDNKNGLFAHGIHIPEGFRALVLTRDEKKDFRGHRKPRGYVRWDILLNPMFAEENAEYVADLQAYGIVPSGENHGQWLAVGARNNKPYIMWPITPISWAEFLAFMADEHPEVEEGSEEWKQLKNDRFDAPWAAQNKHDGLETVLHILEGTTRVGVQFRPFRDGSNPELDIRRWDEMITKHYNSLFTLTTEERRKRQDQENEDGEARRRLAGRVISSVTNPNYQPSDAALKAKSKGKVVVWKAIGEVEEVTVTSLVGKTVKFVAADGNPVKGGKAPLLTEALVLGAIDMAVALNALLQVQ